MSAKRAAMVALVAFAVIVIVELTGVREWTVGKLKALTA